MAFFVAIVLVSSMAMVENVSVFRGDSQQHQGKLLATTAWGVKTTKELEKFYSHLPLATKVLVADANQKLSGSQYAARLEICLMTTTRNLSRIKR